MGSEKDTIAERVNTYCLSVHKQKKNLEGIVSYAYPTYAKKQALPHQGFKIHISATFRNSEKIFDIIIPYLLTCGTVFKVVASNRILRLLNEDRFGYTQVGKFITIYPDSVDKFVSLIYELDKKVINFEAPQIPSDVRLHEKSIVYYRYGVIDHPNNELILPDGNTVKDERDPNLPIPIWVKDPLLKGKELHNFIPQKLLLDRFILLKVLRQRAKGLVGIALDLGKNSTPRVVILKEARRLGALSYQGIDAIDRLEKEFCFMKEVSKLSICPNPIDFIKGDNSAFISMEFWGGKSLQPVLLEDNPPIQSTLIKIFLDAANKLAELHHREIYFFDMNPDNILLNENNEVLLSDFEYALRGSLVHFEGWDGGAPGFSPDATIWETIEAPLKQKLIYKDIYALGNIFLAIVDKEWYRKISQNRLPPLVDWDVRRTLTKLPRDIQDICLKTNLASNERYESVIDLIQNIQGLGTYG